MSSANITEWLLRGQIKKKGSKEHVNLKNIINHTIEGSNVLTFEAKSRFELFVFVVAKLRVF